VLVCEQQRLKRRNATQLLKLAEALDSQQWAKHETVDFFNVAKELHAHKQRCDIYEAKRA